MFVKAFISIAISMAGFSFASATTFNSTNLEKLAIEDFNAVLSETYNEGEGQAEATQAECRIVKRYSNKGAIAFCSLEVKVQPDRSRRYKTTVNCDSMGYQITRDGKAVTNYTGSEECIESINNVTEF